MSSLREIYDQVSAHDARILEKQAAELHAAEEEAAAGKIMARGFADEARKFAAFTPKPPGSTVPETPNDLGAIRQFQLGANGKATGVNPAGQKVQSTATGGMAPPKPPAAPKPAMK